MKMNIKPLGLAAAVAAASVGFAGIANAQGPTGSPVNAVGDLGDLAIVPYYTVQGDWVTGVHIINSSAATQVVKLRLRRASDSADALDFNLIMSPEDEWTGFLDDSTGNIVFTTDDTTCTAPVRSNGQFEMPAIFRAGAEEGYIEVIGMGSPDSETAPIALNAKHTAGVPADCNAVASNFFANGAVLTAKGNVSNAVTVQAGGCPGNPAPALCENDYVDSANALKVSYFLRNAVTGTEMGSSAVHISDASGQAWMTNQETGLFSGDVAGFDYPDLNGGPLLTGDRGLFNQLRAPAALGVSTVLNDWSVASARNVSTDWIVTMPGQYTMLDFVVWASNGFDPANCGKLDDPNTAVDDGIAQCDFRDIPVAADLTLIDREEGKIVPESGDLVISPAPPGTTNTLIFPNEVNVVEWSDGTNAPVLGSSYAVTVDPSVLGESGWASLAVSATKKTATQGGAASPDANSNGQAVCNFSDPAANVAVASHEQRPNTCTPATGNIPVVGATAWQRSFPSNPAGSYGRLIDHSSTR